MSARPWYKRYGGDFVLGTMNLSLEEKGAYSLCLDLIYDRGGGIPDDARWLAGVCGVSVRKWNSLRAALIEAGKITAADGLLSNRRAVFELENAAKTARKLAENGAKGGNKSAEKRAVPKENSDLAVALLKPTCAVQNPESREEPNGSSVAVEPDGSTLSPGGDETPPKGYPEAFEEIWEAYPHIRGRSSKKKAHGYWRRLSTARRASLLPAIVRYGREGREPNDECGAPAMERWLRDERFLDWLDGPVPVRSPEVVDLDKLRIEIAEAEARRLAREAAA